MKKELLTKKPVLYLNKMINRDLGARISLIEAMNDPWVIKHSKSEVDNNKI